MINEIEELLDKQTCKIVEFTGFAEKLGETKGKVDALDDRVKHNCERNEKNFSDIREDIDDVNKNLLSFVQSNEQVISSLKIKNTAKLVFILTMIGVSIVAFIGGSIFDWKKVDSYFEKSSVSERADLVKQGAETISKVMNP